MKARVKVAKGGTFNMGNYESFRYDIGIEVEKDVDQYSDIDDLHEKAKVWINHHFNDAVSKIRTKV